MSSASEEVGDKLAAALGEGPSAATLAAQRVRVMEMALRSFRPRARPNAWTLSLGLVPVVAVAVAVVLYLTRERAFDARFAGTPIAVDAHMVASSRVSDDLDFSDGSRVVLEPGATATLSELGPTHAAVRVEGGRVSASIQKHPGMTWTVTAGPYAVHVVGTRFSVEWNGGLGVFEVLVREGRVRVTGGDLPAAGVVLDPGGRLERHGRKGAEPVLAPEAVREEPPSAKPAEKSEEAAPVSSSSGAISALAVKGKYKEALALAEKQGFDRLIGELPENDLLLLANAARYSGDARRARQALTKLRLRFEGRPAADLAALYLAKVAQDMTHEPTEAVRWLRVFLQSAPSGDLAAGARASLMSLLLRLGDKPAARAVAEDYLRYHATGPHADEARALVRE